MEATLQIVGDVFVPQHRLDRLFILFSNLTKAEEEALLL